MYTRRLALPPRSFFLFGPRGTGKTTWLRDRLPGAKWFDLLLDREMLGLMRDPARFRQELEALPPAPGGAWVVLDEVQRLPALLNDVQDLITRHPRRFRFALTGSSARRLKREQANLLAARVVNRHFFPLTAAEMSGELDSDGIDEILQRGRSLRCAPKPNRVPGSSCSMPTWKTISRRRFASRRRSGGSTPSPGFWRWPLSPTPR